MLDLYILFVKDVWVYIITILTLKVVIVLNLALFVLIPVIFKFSYTLQRKAVFLNYGPISLKIAALLNFNLPRNDNYSDPKLFGLDGARNLLLDNNGVKLGVWQILPSRLIVDRTDEQYFETALGNGQNVVLYNHGNAGSRATGHRVELYKFLRNFFHVIAFDYRGYGDSSVDPPPSEAGVVDDSVFMVNWIRSKIPPDGHLFLWGHSLGSSITLASAKTLKKNNYVPTGIILEAPFNNMHDEVAEFPPTLLFRHLPWFDSCIVDPIIESGFRFQSDEYILDADCPILILHAEDDGTVPFKLGKKLYDVASERRLESQGTVQLQTFPRKFHYGHRYIVAAPELSDIVQSFVRNAINETNTLQL
ncbi:lysophosphatidylserine lipase ABHD12-like isoform X3 [Coccinella septempunctata]|uniref:lysophosphatidylserine lipase ABHD12-like isoform X3 n=1 Tax=Coccinella septempunctata TaxID=41139 RepID=UPI001D06CE1F|nr:lysophosphatidylserine lipase ABHD12-like isoform X3 [Coccinella septempunctata]